MSVSLKVSRGYTVAGKSFSGNRTINGDSAVLKDPGSVAAAKAGQLTTRTDNDTGTLTMSSGHGITTGARLDIFWEEAGVKGSRYGVTVGTVATNSVPIDAGAGDNLPTNLTNITAMVPLEFEITVSSDEIVGACCYAGAQANFVFTDGSDAVQAVFQVDAAGDAAGWDTGEGTTSPFDSTTIVKLYMSHGGAAAAQLRAALVLQDI